MARFHLKVEFVYLLQIKEIQFIITIMIEIYHKTEL